jgi:CSLREA domain-containing protein/uncharacterized repeat protein (TIGR02543 family)
MSIDSKLLSKRIKFLFIVCPTLLLICVLQWTVQGTPSAHAATFIVTKTEDTNDGVCDADCSLREAIIAANADPAADTITLGAGTYLLTIAGTYENAAADGDLDITSSITLNGAGAEQTIIDGSGFPAENREGVFHILSATQDATPKVTIVGVTIQNAQPAVGIKGAGLYIEYANVTVRNSRVINNQSDYWLSGGGILITFGTLTVEDSLIAHNQSTAGGGIYSLATPITITNSIIEHNRTDNSDNPAPGGGIAFYSGALLIQQSKIRHNVATRTIMGGGCGASDGGGIYVNDTGWAETSLQLLDSEVSNNTASAIAPGCTTPTGGGLYVASIKSLLIQNSQILSNTAGIAGGLSDSTIDPTRIVNSNISYNRAIQPPEAGTFNGWAGGVLTGNDTQVLSSTISHNTAAGDGGGISGNAFTISNSLVAYNSAGGDGGGMIGMPYILSSTIHDNSAAYGGGLVIYAATNNPTVENSAIYNNVATQDGGGIYLRYGTKVPRSYEIHVLNSTISGNRAKYGGAFTNIGARETTVGNEATSYTLFRNVTISGNSATSAGGGLHHEERSEIEIENSIVAGNGLAGDCGGAINDDGFVSLGHNLGGDVTCTALNTEGDVTSTDPLLGPLQDNGGPTWTHALPANSPAKDTGNNATCLATDQRGVLRPQGFTCDKGAFEFVPQTPVLNVAPQQVRFAGTLGDSQVLTQSFAIRNAGGGVLNWTLEETIPWLTLSATAGSGPATIVVSVNLTGLEEGTYNGQITVTAPGVAGSPQTVDITLSVNRRVTGVITPVQGGALQTPDDTFSLDFPANAVGAITTVTATLISQPDHPLQLPCGTSQPNLTCVYAGMAVALLATDGDGNLVTNFNLPYTLVLTYDPAFLAAAGITDEENLLWLRWTESGWAGSSCAECVDAPNNRFEVHSSSFSEYALFGVRAAAATFTLTVNQTGDGTVALNPPGGVYSPNTVVQLTATPASGFAFAGWTGAASSSTNPINLTMDSDKTVTANFTALAQNFTLTVNKTGRGEVTLDPPGGTYAAGTEVELTATPDTGFTFASWSGALSGNENPISVTMDGNKTVTATFISSTAPRHTVIVSQIGNGTVTLNPPGGEYAQGTVVQLTALPASDSIFVGWSGAVSGSLNPLEVTIDSDKSIVANFAVAQKVYLPAIQR